MRNNRFDITEEPRCMCGMRVFLVYDHVEGDTTRAHVGTLSPYNLAHKAVRELLRAEREAWGDPELAKLTQLVSRARAQADASDLAVAKYLLAAQRADTENRESRLD